MSEENKDTQVLILYHANCIDGFTSAWAARKGLMNRGYQEENITARAAAYHKLEDALDNTWIYDEIYIVDFSLPHETLHNLSNTAAVTVLDHHKTALEMYAPAKAGKKSIARKYNLDVEGLEIIIDMDECGASLVWNYFFVGREIPELIRYVKDHDIWTHLDEDTKYVNKYLMMQSKDFETWDAIYAALTNIDTPQKLNIISKGHAMHTYHMFLVAEAVSTAVPVSLAGIQGLAVNCPGILASEVGAALAAKSGTYGSSWSQIGNDIKWSLRSTNSHRAEDNEDFDVSALAQKFGGGGHKNAAGFVLSAPQEGQIFPEEGGTVGVDVWGLDSLKTPVEDPEGRN